MKITILTAGTRGDVQPYVALAQGLKKAGHEVTVATGTNFESFVTGHGVSYAPLRVDYYQLIDSPEGRAMMSGNPLRMMQNMKTTVLPLMRRLLDDSWEVSQGSETIIYHPKVLSGIHIAEKLGVPCFVAATVPILTPTRAFPAPGLPFGNLGGWLNKKTYAVVGMASSFFNGIMKSWRKETLGLPPGKSATNDYKINGRPVPILYNYSSHVVPVPDDWNHPSNVTGFWFLDEQSEWQPPAELVEFIESGPAPVYVGFGSMVANDPERMTRTAIAALEKAGQRGVIATGWGAMGDLDVPPTIFKLKDAPHEWLFPRMAAVVHHGGAGTTAAGLRAGKPTVICPFIADQPFWGNAVYRQGLGPKPIPQKKLTVDNLAEAIRVAATDAGMRECTSIVGEKIAAEDGVENAVEVIQHSLANT
jgi:sterol 3beta-glucosyltransferase